MKLLPVPDLKLNFCKQAQKSYFLDFGFFSFCFEVVDFFGFEVFVLASGFAAADFFSFGFDTTSFLDVETFTSSDDLAAAGFFGVAAFVSFRGLATADFFPSGFKATSFLDVEIFASSDGFLTATDVFSSCFEMGAASFAFATCVSFKGSAEAGVFSFCFDVRAFLFFPPVRFSHLEVLFPI